MLEARDVWKEYQVGAVTLPVLKGVSLRCAPGSCVAVVGPSGAGKTTLLHLLAGLDTPTQGHVWWEGRAVSALSDAGRAEFRRATVGIVFQFYHLLPELSALENVMMPGVISGRWTRRAVAARARQWLERVALGARLRHRPRELSGGEQQRVAIARALLNEPRWLLCDEPTGNLDSATGAEMLRLLLDVRRAHGIGLVVVTHQRTLAEAMERVVTLEDGRIVSDSLAQANPKIREA